MRRTLVVFLATAALLGACGGGGSDGGADDDESAPTLPARATTGSCTFDRQTDPGKNHIANPTYEVDPPAGGDHALQPVNRGGYYRPDAPFPPEANLVHSLEHGYVVIWYKPDIDTAQHELLGELFQDYRRDVIIVPRPGLDVPVAATAWHARLLCEEIELEALSTFVQTFANEGPEKVAHP